MRTKCPEHQEQREALERIDKVIDLLAKESSWCKYEPRSSAGGRCILGAMRQAGAEQLLRGPILRAIREVTDQRYWRIDRFNDSSETTHTVVLEAREKLRTDLSWVAPRNTGMHPLAWCEIAIKRWISWRGVNAGSSMSFTAASPEVTALAPPARSYLFSPSTHGTPAVEGA